MISFFRKIRQKLLTINKFTQYLLYAIGEIALVMAGILLALQVNNWNEQKKERIREVSLLRELKGNLETNIQNLEKDIAVQEFLNLWTFRGALRASSTLRKRETAEETRRVIERIEVTLRKTGNGE